MTFAEKVKLTRRTLYISQEGLAKELGVSFATVNRWENGKSEPNLMLEGKFMDFCKSKGIEFKEAVKQ